jgi:hypothetical protein
VDVFYFSSSNSSIYIELICGTFAVIIDKLGHKIFPDKKVDSNSDNDEEKKWRGYSFSSLAFFFFFFLG